MAARRACPYFLILTRKGALYMQENRQEGYRQRGLYLSLIHILGDPRGVLKRVLKKAADMGYDTFNVGPEAEFFLFQTDEEGKPTTKTNDEAGYFDLGPLDHGEGTRREICIALEQMGFEIEASHHEVAPVSYTHLSPPRSPSRRCLPGCGRVPAFLPRSWGR